MRLGIYELRDGCGREHFSLMSSNHFIPKLWLVVALLILGLALSARAEESATGRPAPTVWGVNAITLPPQFAATPSLSEFMANNSNTLSLDRFYRAGGAGVARAATECRIACDSNSLLVAFRCAEADMSFPATNRNANWFSLLDLPSDQDSSFPDKVDLFVRPDMNRRPFYQFTVTRDGLKFGYEHGIAFATRAAGKKESSRHHEHIPKVDAFSASVSTGTNEWTVFVRIPWNTIGGKPGKYFGLLPVRTRWRDGEVSSPVAFDFIERLPTDLFIETHFFGGPPLQAGESCLCRLPSGVSRWQRPAILAYPDSKSVREIWHMEQSLNEPTDVNNFARRLWLTQRWTDLLELEGFNFRLGRGSLVTSDLSPCDVRSEINGALLTGDATAAWRLLDTYLHQLDHVSRQWFADGSPGDILKWTPVSHVTGVQKGGNVLALYCQAGGQPVTLHISLPASGGVRVYDDNEGYFKPEALSPLTAIPGLDSYTIATTNGRVVVGLSPFTISFYNRDGKLVTQLGPNDLAFRFGADGKITAIDFRNGLEPDEVVWGFGERYDRFNENGNVLTLWGMDDYLGNTVGLMNETYKPIALFHSSKGYTVFDDSTYRLRADVGRTDPHHYRLTQQGSVFDFYFWIAAPDRAMTSYTALTGRSILPPKWAFGPWMGRTGRGWAAPSHDPVAEEERVTKRFAALDIPHSAIYAEGTSAESVKLNQFMAARGIKVFSWFWPVVSESIQAKLLPDVPKDELPLLNCENTKLTQELGYIDFTNPHATELMRRWWRHRLNVGVAGSMVDFGDRVPEQAVFYDGRRGDEMHNFYAYDYHRTCAAVFREARGDNFILFGRAAAPGDQRWVAQFAGDHPANFTGLQSVLTGALSLCSCGFSTWGSDLGGFLGWPEPAVYMRWTQFACFSPLMRCHGRTPREPWNYGDAAVANYKYFAWVRENLLDYIYNAAADAHQTGLSMMRSIAMADPDDLSAAANSDEYMFGRDLLVAPVIADEPAKTIVFPPGRWTSLWNGETICGPTNSVTNVPPKTIPVFLKPGAIVPVYLDRELQFGQSMTTGDVGALIVTQPGADEETAFAYDAAPISPTPARPTPGATVSLHPELNGYTVTLDNFQTDYVLVYGVMSVSSVSVNGEQLPELTGTKFASLQNAWETDRGLHRLVIRLPAGKGKMEIKITGT